MLENQLAESLSLNGHWEIALGDQDGSIQVPGAWEVQGYADVEGPALYRKTVDVPANWQGATVWLTFGAVSYYTEVYINGECVGTHEGLWTPFEFDVSSALRYGASNDIELRVTKPADAGDRFPYRDVLVGFIPYVSTTFGGPWQGVTLIAHREAAFSAVYVVSDFERGQVAVTADVGVTDGAVIVEALDKQGTVVAAQTLLTGQTRVDSALTIQDAQPWSPESPALYTLRLRVEQHGQTVAQTERRFGFRQLTAKGERLYLNETPVFLRGVLSWGWNPAALAPIFSDDEIRAEFRRVRELGFNLYKLCLYVPPPRLFEIADEEGMLLWLEMPMWLPRLSDHFRVQSAQEYADILARVHHHPSVVIYSLGCELSADMADAALLGTLNDLTRGTTQGALVCDNSGSGEAYGGLTSDLADFNDYHFYCDLQYFTPLCDHFRRDWRPERPWIFGEFCDSDDLRDPSELVDNGQRPWWRDLLAKDGRLDRWAYRDQEQRVAAADLPFSASQLMRLSRQTSFIVRKAILEKVRKRRDMAGYVVTGLRDTPISTSGMFDDLGRAKYDAGAFKQFNADAVLLLDQGRARAWVNGGDRPAPFDRHNHRAGTTASFRVILANTGESLPAAQFNWSLVRQFDRQPVVNASRAIDPMPARGPLRELASFEIPMPPVKQATQYRLRVTLDGEGVALTNDWPLWVYPPLRPENVAVYDPAQALEPSTDFWPERAAVESIAAPDPRKVLVATTLSNDVLSFVRLGGSAVVLQSGPGALPTHPVPFWRESIKLIYDHPIMQAFPHQGFTDLQFYHLATDVALDTQALVERLGASDVRPLLRRLDARLFTVLDYVVEVRLGKGRLIASTLRFQGGSGDQVAHFSGNVAAQHLLGTMIGYLQR